MNIQTPDHPPPDSADGPAGVSGLTPRQEDFCRAYVLDPNATRAAVSAGYARPSAHVTGHRLLRNAKIEAHIRELRADIARRHCMDAASLMGKLEAVFHRAYEDHQMHACVRAVGLQARLAGVLADDDRRPPVIEMVAETPDAGPPTGGPALVPQAPRGPSTRGS